MYQPPKPPEAHSGGGTAVENGIAPSAPQPEIEGRDEADVIELLLVLARQKKRILQITWRRRYWRRSLSFLLPKMYTATATILPPQQKQSALNSMLGQIGAIARLGEATISGLKNPADLFVAMLKSRTIEDNLINRFDLRKVYWVKRYQDARKKLDSRSDISAGDEGADLRSLLPIAIRNVRPKSPTPTWTNSTP